MGGEKKVQKQPGLAALLVDKIAPSKVRRRGYRIDEPQLLGASDGREEDDQDDDQDDEYA